MWGLHCSHMLHYIRGPLNRQLKGPVILLKGFTWTLCQVLGQASLAGALHPDHFDFFLAFNKFIGHILECIKVIYEFIEGMVEAGRPPPYVAQKCSHLCTASAGPTCSIKSQDHFKPFKRVLEGFCDFIEVFKQVRQPSWFNWTLWLTFRAGFPWLSLALSPQSLFLDFNKIIRHI